MEPLKVETNQISSQYSDLKNDIIEQAISSPIRTPIKTTGIVNSNARYMFST